MVKSALKRVNLGSGTDYIKDWINVDIFPSSKVDVVADLTKRFPFDNDSIDEIKASDILEHFTKEDGVIFLKECHRVLKKNGKIVIRTHNIDQIIKQFGYDQEVMIHFIYGNTSQTGVFGAHKYAYTKKNLKRTLTKLGFKVNSIHQETTNFVISAFKTVPFQKRLHIGIIQQTPDLGGAETYMFTLMKEFIHDGHKVRIATNNEKFKNLLKTNKINADHIPVILDIIGNYKGLLKAIFYLPYAFFYYCRLLTLYKKEKIDVLMMSGFSEKMLVTFLSKFYNLPIVWIEYGPLETIFVRNFRLPKILYRLLKEIPEFIIIPSTNTMTSLMRHGRVSLAKLQVIPCGIENPEGLSLRNESISKKYQDKFVIGNVSRLTREKGQQFIIGAMPQILKKVPNAHLILIGAGLDEAYFSSLIVKHHMQNHISMIGFVQDLDSYYAAMDIFVFPTIWDLEGFGMVTVEAMSHGLPVIASNIGPLGEIVVPGETGILVKPGSSKEIADEAIRLAYDKKLRNYMGIQAKKRVMETYTSSHIGKCMISVLQDATI